MIKRIIILFPIMLFVLIRELYANLLGVDKDILTAALVFGLSILAFLAFQARMRESRRDLLLIDFMNLVCGYLSAAAIVAYFIAGKIETNQAIYAAYYYGAAPFLLYSGFLFRNLSSTTKRAALVAMGCAYLVTFWVAIYESLGIDFWLFAYSRWTLQKNYAGVTRASGLYGTQIDYGALSFLVFTVALYCNSGERRNRRWFGYLLLAASTGGVLLSMSRAWMGALALVVAIHAMHAQSLKRKLKIAFVALLAGVLLYTIADRLGFVDMLGATDAYTQDSNEARIVFLQNTPKWMKEFALVGTGPGTQNGPDVHSIKFIGDFLWLAIVVEFGTMLGMFMVLSRVVLIGCMFYQVRRLRSSDSALRPIVSIACIAFLMSSFVDSAFAHIVTVSVFYALCGLLLPELETQPSAKRSFSPELQPSPA